MIAAPTKPNSQPEPTMSDLMDSIIGLSNSHEKLAETVSNLAETMNTGFEKVWGILSTLQIGQDSLLVEVQDVKRRVIKLEFQFVDFQDTLNDLGEAESKDALASMNHEARIVRLEKIHNIEPVSIPHLREIE